MSQLDEYDTFTKQGKGVSAPHGYKKIRVHLIFDIKHDGRHNARCVVDGYLTNISVDSIYSGFLSLGGLRIMLFLAELNKLDIWATDIDNTYLEANTSENVYTITWTEFGKLRGCTLIIHNVLYWLRSNSLQ